MQKQEAWLSQLFPFDCNDTWYFVINGIANPVARMVAHRKIQTALTTSFVVGSRRSLSHRDRDDEGYTGKNLC